MKKMLFTYILLLVFAAMNVYAATAQDIIKSLEKLKSYSADFVQTTEIEGFGEDSYSGKLYILSGKKAFWDYSKPYRQFYLFDTDTMKYYDSETRQLIIQKLTPANNIFMRLMLNPSDIEKDFNVSLSGSELVLMPKQEIGVGTITFIVEGGLVKGIKTVDQSGNNTTIEMKNIASDKAIPADIFEPVIPEGTEVFEYN